MKYAILSKRRQCPGQAKKAVFGTGEMWGHSAGSWAPREIAPFQTFGLSSFSFVPLEIVKIAKF